MAYLTEEQAAVGRRKSKDLKTLIAEAMAYPYCRHPARFTIWSVGVEKLVHRAGKRPA